MNICYNFECEKYTTKSDDNCGDGDILNPYQCADWMETPAGIHKPTTNPEPIPSEFCKGPFASQVGGSHYQNGNLPGPAEWCMRQGMGNGESQAVKYIYRHPQKGDGIGDLKKAMQYIRFVAFLDYGVEL